MYRRVSTQQPGGYPKLRGVEFACDRAVLEDGRMERAVEMEDCDWPIKGSFVVALLGAAFIQRGRVLFVFCHQLVIVICPPKQLVSLGP
jgi:hypothetical protein